MKYFYTVCLSILSLTVFTQAYKPATIRWFMQAPGEQGSAINYGVNAKAGDYALSGNDRIYYEVYGKGQPVIVLHGGMVGSLYEMGRLIDSLSRSYQVIAVSTRGHGKSDMGSDHSYAQKAKDVVAVINKLKTDSVTVFGFSDGGYTGYLLASLY
ncbi:MAG: alpha/beta hydrolase, partial [Pedobacter sp.]